MPRLTANAAGVGQFPNLFNVGPPTAIAAAGSAQGNATALTGRFNIVSGADNAKGVILPSTSSPGDVILVYSSTASVGLLVYPHSGGTINDGSGNASIAQEGKSLFFYVNQNGTNWLSNGLLNS